MTSMAEQERFFAFDDDQREYLRAGLAAEEALLSPYATRHADAVYERDGGRRHGDAPGEPSDVELVRPAFVRDVDRVLNNAFYNRCMDKTQVFPFYQNDDLTRRAFHLQLVSRISRKVAQALRLNVALTEAIALAHDMGHTPFGHGGERMLNDLYRKHAGRCFNHNVHGVRLLRDVATCNLSLQTYNGILCHCGEKAFERYEPAPCESFDALDAMMEHCYQVPGSSQDLRPSTLEGCVVRICDILAYLGKDRQDALKIHVLTPETYPMRGELVGENNAQIIQNATANIIKNSIDKPYLAMDPEVFESILRIKDNNAANIYHSPQAHEQLDAAIQPMMEQLYERFRADVKAGDESSYIFRHHINNWVMQFNEGYVDKWSPDDIVVDYIASMTDDYFIDLFNFLYPDQAIPRSQLYHPYFYA
ncbi:MAG: HD domain-containing protein [Coriobacteriaceae bacterium]|nr:HD domain-containing protein [Coriobacteriaceae bacterium]